MHTLAENVEVLAVDASCTGDTLTVTLSDGRMVSAPLAWFPRLLEATPKQRAEWELIGAASASTGRRPTKISPLLACFTLRTL